MEQFKSIVTGFKIQSLIDSLINYKIKKYETMNSNSSHFNLEQV